MKCVDDVEENKPNQAHKEIDAHRNVEPSGGDGTGLAEIVEQADGHQTEKSSQDQVAGDLQGGHSAEISMTEKKKNRGGNGDGDGTAKQHFAPGEFHGGSEQRQIHTDNEQSFPSAVVLEKRGQNVDG